MQESSLRGWGGSGNIYRLMFIFIDCSLGYWSEVGIIFIGEYFVVEFLVGVVICGWRFFLD